MTSPLLGLRLIRFFAFSLASTALLAQSPLAVVTTSLPAGTTGQPYSATLTASGGTPPYIWTVGSGFPSGLSVSSSGLISGTLAAAGSFNFPVQVTDVNKASAVGQLSLTIQVAPLTITTVPPLFAATVGTAYVQPFSASGGQPPYTWSIVFGEIPGGLTLDRATGNLAGTPVSPGTFSFSLRVADTAGSSTTGSFSVTVNAPALTISVAALLPAGTVGIPYSQVLPVSANGGVAPYTWTIVGTPPPGLTTLDPNTRLLTGTPITSGQFVFTVQAKDASGLTATKALTLTVNPPALTIPSSVSRQLNDAVLNAAYSSPPLTAVGGQPPYRWSANGLPGGLSINSASGQITGIPTAAGIFGIAITVTDNALTNYSDRFTLNVNLPSLPSVSLSGLPNNVSPAQPYTIQVTLGASYAAPISGQAILAFSPNTGPNDRTIQFSSGGTTANFNIPVGSTTPDAPLVIQTGTVSGTLTISLRLQTGGLDITPQPAPSITAQISAAAPVIKSVQVNRSGSTLNVVVTGYSTSREITQAVFAFSAVAGQTLQPAASSITLDVSNLFGTWFLDPNNSQFGSIFVYTQPFTVQGDATAVIPVSVALTNRIGSTTATIAQ